MKFKKRKKKTESEHYKKRRIRFNIQFPDFKKMIVLQNYNFATLKISLIFYAVAATILGIIVIGSAKKSVQSTQIGGFIFALCVMAFIALIDYKWIVKWYYLLYVASIVLLLAVVLFGSSSGGAERWLVIGPLRFQPSEIVKILLILFFSVYLKENRYNLHSWKGLIKPLCLMAVPLFLILKQPDLSTTIVTALILISIMFIAGLNTTIIKKVLMIGIPAVLIFLLIAVQPWQPFLKDYQQKRILAWFDPEKYADSDAMQQQNSIMAIGSGQLTGKGLNNNKVASMKNGNFVPEPQTDFIFAVVGEELGFVGTSLVIILLLAIVLSILSVAKRCTDLTGKYICVGMASLIGFQSMVNLAVTTGLFPNTGVTLPFISYGMTSLVSLYIGLGIVLNIAMQPNQYEYGKMYY